MEKIIDPRRLLSSLSTCLDFAKEGLGRHHKQVAFIGMNLAQEIGLKDEDKDLLFKASIVHDAGVSTFHEKSQLINFEVEEPWDHCRNGYELVRRVDFLRRVAEIILYHHDRFEGKNRSGLIGREIPLAARIIHLADRVDILLKRDRHVLEQQSIVSDKVEELAGEVFDPELVEVFTQVSRRESFWLDLTSPFLRPEPEKSLDTGTGEVGITEEDLRQIAEMFAKVIDRKSTFTHRHSRGVAGVSARLAEVLGFDREKVVMMEVAGLLHDVGKLSIPDEILEKPAALTREEHSIIKQHTYYTLRILEAAGVPDPIPEWAGNHHEKLDGSGYPFHLDADQITLGARIVAVADVFNALHEDRPYRPGMNKSQIERVMRGMVVNNALDGDIVKLLLDLYDELVAMFDSLSL